MYLLTVATPLRESSLGHSVTASSPTCFPASQSPLLLLLFPLSLTSWFCLPSSLFPAGLGGEQMNEWWLSSLLLPPRDGQA